MVGAGLSSWSLLVTLASLSASSSDLRGQTSRRHRFLNPINVVGNLALGNRPKIKSGFLLIITKIQNSCPVSFHLVMMTTFNTCPFFSGLALSIIQRKMYIGRNALQLCADELKWTFTCVKLIFIHDHHLQIHFPNLECTSDDGTIGKKSKKGDGVFQNKWGWLDRVMLCIQIHALAHKKKSLSKQMLQKSDFHRTTDISNHNEPSVWRKELVPL